MSYTPDFHIVLMRLDIRNSTSLQEWCRCGADGRWRGRAPSCVVDVARGRLYEMGSGDAAGSGEKSVRKVSRILNGVALADLADDLCSALAACSRALCCDAGGREGVLAGGAFVVPIPFIRGIWLVPIMERSSSILPRHQQYEQ